MIPTAKKSLLVVVGLSMAFLVSEVSTRIFLPEPQQITIENPDVKRRLQEENRVKRDFTLPGHPEQGGLYIDTPTGRRLRANTRVIIDHHLLSKQRIVINTNSIGYRNREIGTKDRKRILFLGDSITFGDFLPEEETFVRRIEDAAKQDGEMWETINAGVGSISLKTEVAILRETGLKLKPDVVVVCFYLNDFSDSPGVHIRPIPSFLRWSRMISYLYLYSQRLFGDESNKPNDHFDFGSSMERFLIAHPVGEGNWRTDKAAFNAILLQYFRDFGAAWTDAAWNRVNPLIWELKKLSEKHHFDLILVAFPVRFQVEAEFLDDFPQRKLQEIARRFEVPYLDLLQPFRALHRNSRNALFYDHCHHTSHGNETVAAYVYKFLQNKDAN